MKEKVWSLHCKGLAPSQIARKLKITQEEAHDIIVERWAIEKNGRHHKHK